MDIIHPVDVQHPHPRSTVYTNTDARTSEHPDSIVMGNHDGSERVDEISINYIDYEESFDKKLQLSTHTSPQILQTTFSMIQIPNHGRVPQALGLNTMKGCNPSRIALALQKRCIHISNTYSS